MQYCTKCGRQLAEDEAFCDGCGQSLRTSVSQKVETIPPRDDRKEAANRRRPVLGILCILGAVAIIVAVILAAIAQY